MQPHPSAAISVACRSTYDTVVASASGSFSSPEFDKVAVRLDFIALPGPIPNFGIGGEVEHNLTSFIMSLKRKMDIGVILNMLKISFSITTPSFPIANTRTKRY